LRPDLIDDRLDLPLPLGLDDVREVVDPADRPREPGLGVNGPRERRDQGQDKGEGRGAAAHRSPLRRVPVLSRDSHHVRESAPAPRTGQERPPRGGGIARGACSPVRPVTPRRGHRPCPRQDSNLRRTRFRKPPLYPPELRGRGSLKSSDFPRPDQPAVYFTSECTGKAESRWRPPRKASSRTNAAATTRPPSCSRSRAAARAVPPVASTSSMSRIRWPSWTASTCASRASTPYSRAYSMRRVRYGSLPGLRTGANPVPRWSATGAAKMNPRASIPTTRSTSCDEKSSASCRTTAENSSASERTGVRSLNTIPGWGKSGISRTRRRMRAASTSRVGSGTAVPEVVAHDVDQHRVERLTGVGRPGQPRVAFRPDPGREPFEAIGHEV